MRFRIRSGHVVLKGASGIFDLSDEIRRALTSLAHRDHVPEATKAARLLEVALEIEEDQILDKIASSRDNSRARFISHKKAWA